MSIPLYHTFFCPSIRGWGNNTRKLLKEFEITGAIADFDREQFRRVVQKIYADSDVLTFRLVNNLELDIRIEEVL